MQKHWKNIRSRKLVTTWVTKTKELEVWKSPLSIPEMYRKKNKPWTVSLVKRKAKTMRGADILDQFKTKKEAISYAKKYMKTHK